MPEGADPLVGVRNFRVFVGKREFAVAQVRGLTWGTAPGAGQPGPAVVLRRALGADQELFRWRERAAAKGDARDVHIDLYDGTGERPLATWALVGARPVRWSGPDLDALGNEVAMEELELTHDGLEWLEQPGGRRRRPPTT